MIINIAETPSILINSKSQPWRLATCTALFNSLGFAPFYKQEVVVNPLRKVSIAMSHLAAAVKKTPPFIIYEDDIAVNPSVTSFIIEVPDDTDAVYLGVSKNGAHCMLDTVHGALFSPFSDTLAKVEETFCAHAILFVSQRAIDAQVTAIAEAFEIGEAQDVRVTRALAKLNTYCTIDPFFYQNDGDRIGQTLFNVAEYMAEDTGFCRICGKVR